MNNNLLKILSSDAFNCLKSEKVIKAAEINAIILMLFAANIPFDINFSPSNGKFAKQIRLKIFISPAIIMNLNFQFEAGDIAFV
ncbi:MAG: hypothetical protein ACM3X7_05680 [Solirubrobacterales bacterium]